MGFISGAGEIEFSEGSVRTDSCFEFILDVRDTGRTDGTDDLTDLADFTDDVIDAFEPDLTDFREWTDDWTLDSTRLTGDSSGDFSIPLDKIDVLDAIVDFTDCGFSCSFETIDLDDIGDLTDSADLTVDIADSVDPAILADLADAVDVTVVVDLAGSADLIVAADLIVPAVLTDTEDLTDFVDLILDLTEVPLNLTEVALNLTDFELDLADVALSFTDVSLTLTDFVPIDVDSTKGVDTVDLADFVDLTDNLDDGFVKRIAEFGWHCSVSGFISSIAWSSSCNSGTSGDSAWVFVNKSTVLEWFDAENFTEPSDSTDFTGNSTDFTAAADCIDDTDFTDSSIGVSDLVEGGVDVTVTALFSDFAFEALDFTEVADFTNADFTDAMDFWEIDLTEELTDRAEDLTDVEDFLDSILEFTEPADWDFLNVEETEDSGISVFPDFEPEFEIFDPEFDNFVSDTFADSEATDFTDLVDLIDDCEPVFSWFDSIDLFDFVESTTDWLDSFFSSSIWSDFDLVGCGSVREFVGVIGFGSDSVISRSRVVSRNRKDLIELALETDWGVGGDAYTENDGWSIEYRASCSSKS